jgi:hypothetical protein
MSNNDLEKAVSVVEKYISTLSSDRKSIQSACKPVDVNDLSKDLEVLVGMSPKDLAAVISPSSTMKPGHTK